MLKNYLLLLLGFVHVTTSAQTAQSSLFANVKSVNPAVISRRPGEVISILGKADKITKKQSLSADVGDAVTGDNDTKIDVASLSLFRGGKGGGRLTTEMEAAYIQGKKTDKLASISETTSIETDANNTLFYFGAGIGKNFGLSITHVNYSNSSQYDATFAGSPISMNSKTEVTADDIKAGVSAPLGSLSIGAFFLHSIADVESIVEGQVMPNAGKDKQNIGGIALATGSKSFHLEIGYERNLEEEENPFTGDTLHPSRLTGTIEAQIGKVLLGYTGRYYTDGFFEIDRVIYDQFVYENSYTEPRLDNVFNFSYGRDKGNVFSASIFYSQLKAKETNSFFPDGSKVMTTTTEMGASLKYAYHF